MESGDKMKDKRKIVHYDEETGVILTDREFSDVKKKEREEKISKLKAKFQKHPEKLNIHELEFLLSLRNGSHNVIISYERYTIHNDSDIYWKLENVTFKVLTIISLKFLSYSGFVSFKNGKRINTYDKIREICGISKYVWRKVSKDVNKYNLFKKCKIDGKTYLVMNPFLYYRGRREITEFQFIAFFETFKAQLSRLTLYYLIAKFGINPGL